MYGLEPTNTLNFYRNTVRLFADLHRRFGAGYEIVPSKRGKPIP
jgi:hypothetical protein